MMRLSIKQGLSGAGTGSSVLKAHDYQSQPIVKVVDIS
jgi:hypothetical protein